METKKLISLTVLLFGLVGFVCGESYEGILSSYSWSVKYTQATDQASKNRFKDGMAKFKFQNGDKATVDVVSDSLVKIQITHKDGDFSTIKLEGVLPTLEGTITTRRTNATKKEFHNGTAMLSTASGNGILNFRLYEKYDGVRELTWEFEFHY